MRTTKDMTTACKVNFLLFALFSSIDLFRRYSGKLSKLSISCLACFARFSLLHYPFYFTWSLCVHTAFDWQYFFLVIIGN